MLRRFIRVIALVLAATLVISVPVNVYAEEVQSKEIISDSTIDLGDVVITAYQNEDGDSIICEYTDGTLTQKNTVPYNRDGVIIREVL